MWISAKTQIRLHIHAVKFSSSLGALRILKYSMLLLADSEDSDQIVRMRSLFAGRTRPNVHFLRWQSLFL